MRNISLYDGINKVGGIQSFCLYHLFHYYCLHDFNISFFRVFCAVSASLVEPSQTRPQKGIVSVEVDMSPMGNPGLPF